MIGGEKEARKQIYGLLHTEEVEKKLTEAFSSIGEREQMRSQLGQFIQETFQKFADDPYREQILSVLGEALKDPGLRFNNVIDVFTASAPIERYDEVRREINQERLLHVSRVAVK